MLCGLLRAGPRGALAAWLGFTSPSALIMAGVAVALGTAARGTPPAWFPGLLDGLFAAAAGVVATAVWGLARSLIDDAVTAGIAAVSAVVALVLYAHPGFQWVPIALGALTGAFALHGTVKAQGLPIEISRTASTVAAIVLAAFVALALVPHATPVVSLLATLVRAGTLVFGGGHVILPFLQSLIREGLIGQREFFAGYGAAQAIPGPLNTFATFIGVLNRSALNGAAGGFVATIFIFAPSFALIFALAPVWNRIAEAPRAGGALRGANASVVGLLAAVLIDPIALSLAGAWWRIALALAAFVALLRWKIAPWIVVVVSALIGAGVGAVTAR